MDGGIIVVAFIALFIWCVFRLLGRSRRMGNRIFDTINGRDKRR